MERNCLQCNSVFVIAANNQKYCCIGCRVNATKKGKGLANCQHCGAVFHKTGSNHKYCSINCKLKKTILKRYDKCCKRCGRNFDTTHAGSIWCSLECANKDRCKPHIDVLCLCCGKEMSVTEILQKRKRYCSKECHNKCKLGRSLSVETKIKIGLSQKGKIVSAETRAKRSVTMSDLVLSGANNYWFKRGYIYSSKVGKKVFYRSSYEKKVLEYFEIESKIIGYDYESLKIPYLFENFQKHYIPDFLVQYVDGSQKLIEIKPSCFVDYPINLAKFAAAREYCESNNMTFEIWTEIDITALIEQERTSNEISQ